MNEAQTVDDLLVMREPIVGVGLAVGCRVLLPELGIGVNAVGNAGVGGHHCLSRCLGKGDGSGRVRFQKSSFVSDLKYRSIAAGRDASESRTRSD
jgi:hypothetical protein